MVIRTIPYIVTQAINSIAIRVVYVIGLILVLDAGIYSLVINGNNDMLVVIFFPLANLVFPSLHYMGYATSFIIFGSYLILLNYKFKLLSIPIAITTYVLWEISGQGYHIINTSPNYYFFYVLLAITIISVIPLYKYTIIKLSPLLLMIYLVVYSIPFPASYYFEPVSEVTWVMLFFTGVKLKH